MTARPEVRDMVANVPGAREETIETVSRNLILLFPLFHGKIISRGRGIPGMQIAGFRVLGVLLRCGPLPISEVGKRLYISKPYMTRLVDGLIAEDLVERLPDSSDRRVTNIRITGKGRNRIEEIGTIFKDDIKALLSDLSDEDIRVLDASLKNLNRVLGKLAVPGEP